MNESNPIGVHTGAGSGDLTGSPLRSTHSNSLPQVLSQLHLSVMISTYQAGWLVCVRYKDGVLNTDFQPATSPMGMAYDGRRLAVGTKVNITEWHNQPSVARRMDPPDKYDGCLLPRRIHYTGDIAVHDIAWGRGADADPARDEHETWQAGRLPHEDDLWIVNTRFSTLCTLDSYHSFVPRWRPKFVSALAPEDRCHLNGLAMLDGRPKYVTVLGQTDRPGGWRADKAFGGCILDVESDEPVCEGLSMPPSPRWHDGRLWVLESGDGNLSAVDLQNGKLEVVTRLPGYTRGLDFYGPYAFIGLSQIRETSVFRGLPITERDEPRHCGMWVVDTRSGETIAMLRFDDAVQEIFGIAVLPELRYPAFCKEDSLIGDSFILPDAALKDTPDALVRR